ncbi:hypothetical protein HYW59_00210 [Candidatus Kaiserbacteria bacterium]|nr:hypothetical protein [Candidatus Kaiserbacteria bacterium]
MDKFSATASIRAGWSTFKRRPWFLVGMTALMLVLTWVIGAISGVFGEKEAPGLLGTLLNLGLSTLLSMGFTALVIRAHDTIESAEVGDLWHPKPFWKFLAAEFLVGVIVFIGLILLIVPGVIAILMLLFSVYIVIDRELGPIEAMKESMRITRGSRSELLLLVLMCIVLNILGMAALIVGLFISIPITALAVVHAYRTLERKAEATSA